jgi:hypothetical protein
MKSQPSSEIACAGAEAAYSPQPHRSPPTAAQSQNSLSLQDAVDGRSTAESGRDVTIDAPGGNTPQETELLREQRSRMVINGEAGS